MVEIKYTITDPTVIPQKNPKSRNGVAEDAPGCPMGRFGVTMSFETESELHSWGHDGCTMNYLPGPDNCDWSPCKVFYGKGYKTINHPGETTSAYIKQALGFPEYNPGWGDGSDLAAEARVKNGLWLKVFTAARVWRNQYVTQVVYERKVAEERLAEEIGVYTDGKD